MTGLHTLAEAAGLQIEWEDAAGDPQTVGDDSLRAVLAALGFRAETERDIADSLETLRQEAALCRFVSADCGEAFLLPPACGDSGGAAELRLENGERRTIQIERTAAGLRVPAIELCGYHELHLCACSIRLAIAPPRCFGVADATGGKKAWGSTVQVPSLCGDEDSNGGARAFGDFSTLAVAARGLAGSGADALAISPTHALFPADGSRFSPYSPSSRLFLNIMFGDPGLIGQKLPAEPADALIGWERAIPARLALLRETFRIRGDAVKDKVAAFRQEGGRDLANHAIFDALHAHFFDRGVHGLHEWPREFHDPESAAVARFAAAHGEEVDFFVFAQWLAKASLEKAQDEAREAGMAIGLVSDLAVGMDGGGSYAWSRPGDLLTGLSIGAPPDLLGPDGQDWGITGLSPLAMQRTAFAGFIATLRAALAHAGGIRIDHALGLRRLWVIPVGLPSSQGAYLRFPLADMLRILAIESHRARAIVIGEDLGTVPEGLRPELEARQVAGMRVLWFERGEDGSFLPPATWQEQAVAMTGTHDLATVAGWWTGRDIEWNRKLGRGAKADFDEEFARRAADRARLWDALVASGAASGPQPAAGDPQPAVDAALVHVGLTPCELALLPIEDLLGLIEQPNLPGTIDEHPNWRRRMDAATPALLADPVVAGRLSRIKKSRR